MDACVPSQGVTAANAANPATGESSRLDRLRSAMHRPVSSASVAVLRIAFGVGMVINTLLYLPVLVRQYYVDPTVSFPYGPLQVVQPLPGPGMYLVFVAMVVTGAMIAAGWHYRLAAWSFFGLTTYVFLLDSTYFQNHEYLISLLALMLALLPAHCRWSLDARRHPGLRSDVLPAWVVWLLRFQVGVPYFFGGVAKLNEDWFRGEPLRRWLAERTELEPMHSVLTNEGVVWFMTYGALALDLLVVWFLLHRRTRTAAFVIVTCFHLMNAWLFGLYIFPWLMISATTIFFAPDWPERALRTPVLAALRARFEARRGPRPEVAAPRRTGWRGSPALLSFFAIWVVLQLVLPLRHYALPGSPSWTEEGHRFAWHMKLRDKVGTAEFVLTDGERTWRVDPSDHLDHKQLRRLAGHPERLVIFSRYLSDLHGGVEVRAHTWVSMNGRPPQAIVDPEVDLSSVPLSPWRTDPWILPLDPLP